MDKNKKKKRLSTDYIFCKFSQVFAVIFFACSMNELIDRV